MPSAFSWPIWASLLANIALFSVKLACFLRAKSLAVAASLLDSTLDLLAQCLLAVAAALGERPDPRFPVGARRLEAAAVIVVAAVFAVGAAEVATECVSRLARGASAPTPTLTKTDLFLLFGVVAAKLALFAACVAFTRSERAADRLVSPSIKALAADHAADALTNGVALLAAFGAAAANAVAAPEKAKRWSTPARLADPLGGLVIAVAVFVGWGVQAWDHVSKLVGKRASRETRAKIQAKVEERRRAFLSSAFQVSSDDERGDDGESLERSPSSPPPPERNTVIPSRRFVFDVDVIRAYHGGERVVVEAEVVMAPETTLRESHDACLLLQQDLESMDEVERAFVHADYAKRAAPEHAGDASRATEARIRHRARSRREASRFFFCAIRGRMVFPSLPSPRTVATALARASRESSLFNRRRRRSASDDRRTIGGRAPGKTRLSVSGRTQASGEQRRADVRGRRRARVRHDRRAVASGAMKRRTTRRERVKIFRVAY